MFSEVNNVSTVLSPTVDKLNKLAPCEGQSLRAEEVKSSLGWPSLQGRRDSLKCVLVYKRVHGIASFYLLSEFRHAHQFHGYNTKSRDLVLSGLFRKQLSTKEALE